MLRNIPNNITYLYLRRLINITRRGKYIFSYLRTSSGKMTTAASMLHSVSIWKARQSNRVAHRAFCRPYGGHGMVGWNHFENDVATRACFVDIMSTAAWQRDVWLKSFFSADLVWRYESAATVWLLETKIVLIQSSNIYHSSQHQDAYRYSASVTKNSQRTASARKGQVEGPQRDDSHDFSRRTGAAGHDQ